MQHPGLYIAFWFTLQVQLFSFQKRRHMSIVLAISAVVAPPFMDFFCSSRANAKTSFQKLYSSLPESYVAFGVLDRTTPNPTDECTLTSIEQI
jgi:hypothetical protein